MRPLGQGRADAENERLRRVLLKYARTEVTRLVHGSVLGLLYCEPLPDDRERWTKVIYDTREKAMASDDALQKTVGNQPGKPFPCHRSADDPHWHLTHRYGPQRRVLPKTEPVPLTQRPFEVLATLKLTAPETGEDQQ